jgi:peptidoglycan/LPS O-acetylase OafA/YrhL
VPSPTVARRHDISYGVYIYAFPIQQLLVYAGAHRLGLVAYDVLAALATAALAVVSWRVVERPALRWARHRFRPAAASATSHRVAQELPGRLPPTTRDDAGEQAQGVRP